MGSSIGSECVVADFGVNGKISAQRVREIKEISGKFGINVETLIQKQNFGIIYLYLPFAIGPLKTNVSELYMTLRNKWMNSHQPYYL